MKLIDSSLLPTPCRQTSVEQDCEVPGTGAPPQSPSAVSRYNEEIVSMRRRSGKVRRSYFNNFIYEDVSTNGS